MDKYIGLSELGRDYFIKSIILIDYFPYFINNRNSISQLFSINEKGRLLI